MKHTDTELEEILNQLIASTRSPRGRFSAAASYSELEKRLKSHTRHLTLIRTFSAAAAVALLCLSVWTAYLYMQPAAIQTISTLAETRTVRLPDGSSVMLNHYSSLSYPEKFQSDKREVELNGEAYFEVSKDSKHPFIVQTETIDVQVLGTHFNVDAYHDNPDVKTTLLSGSVAVSNKSKSVRMVLKPNEIAIYNKVEDFAMEFHSSGDGRFNFIGYSQFLATRRVYIRRPAFTGDCPRTVQLIRSDDPDSRYNFAKLPDHSTIPRWRRSGNYFICIT